MDGSGAVRLMTGFGHATSATIQYGENYLWIADYKNDAIYQAMLNGNGIEKRFTVKRPRYITYYASSAGNTRAPTFVPSEART